MVKLLCMLLAAFSLSACGGTGAPVAPGTARTGTAETGTVESQPSTDTESSQEESALKITVGDQELLAPLQTTAPPRNSESCSRRGR